MKKRIYELLFIASLIITFLVSKNIYDLISAKSYGQELKNLFLYSILYFMPMSVSLSAFSLSKIKDGLNITLFILNILVWIIVVGLAVLLAIGNGLGSMANMSG